MPLYPELVAEQLEDSRSDIRDFGREDDLAVSAYRNCLKQLTDATVTDIVDDVGGDRDTYPGALPTRELEEYAGPTVAFQHAAEWESHEAVNNYAADILEGNTTIGADGSELGPTQEFTVPLGFVQVAWCRNGHQRDREYESGISTRLLVPDDLIEDRDDGRQFVDGQIPAHERYRLEAKTIVECIEQYAELDPPPVVFYDGPLVPSFANTFAPEIRDEYYRKSMSRVLAASEHHGVPVIGYTAGSTSTNLVKLLRRRYRTELEEFPFIPDARLLEAFVSQWGDRSLLYINRQDGAVDALSATYHGESYEFWDDVLFTYVDIPGGDAFDRVELPGWVLREGLTEYVFDVIRAEAGVGRGYPEILQQADANAVLDAAARRQFLEIVQEFAVDHDLPIKWDAKALSKERRRR